MFKTLIGSVACFLRSKRGGFCGILLAGLLFSGAFQAVAEDKKEVSKLKIYQEASKGLDKTYVLDGKTYTKADLIRDFLNVAFSETLWNEDMGEAYREYFPIFLNKLNHVSSEKEKSLIKMREDVYTWYLAEFGYQKKKFPKFGAVNKWTTDQIAIGLDYPAYGQYMVPMSEYNLAFYSKVTEQVKAVLPDIEKAVAKKIVFQGLDDPNEKTPNFARVRIEAAYPDLNNFFKKDFSSGGLATMIDGGWDSEHQNLFYWGAVRFTPNVRSQVEGYLLPEVGNALGLAVCKIIPVVSEDILRALVTECLTRAMGLSDLSRENEDSILGNWNGAYDAYSKLPGLDGDASSKRTLNADGLLPPLTSIKFPKIDNNDVSTHSKLAEYDRFMLQLLYCPQVKQGMDKYEVMSILWGNDECFNNGQGLD